MSLLIRALFLFALHIPFNQGLHASIESNLKKVPFEDRFYLKFFLRDVFLHENMGHVLFFDNKPACFTGFALGRQQHYLEKLLSKGWMSWKKYEHLFPHPNFIFIEEIICLPDTKLMHIY